jgi:hypothetical protein
VDTKVMYHLGESPKKSLSSRIFDGYAPSQQWRQKCT